MQIEYYPAFEPDQFFHIFNQGNARSNIFFEQENYRYFLEKYNKYLLPFLDTYAYCLIPNHFHFLAKVKPVHELLHIFPDLDQQRSNDIASLAPISQQISEMFRRFFMSYSKAINVQEQRSGSLFRKNVKRKLIVDENYLRQAMCYIHWNPQRHQLVKDFKNYKFSSYPILLSNENTFLKRDDAINVFENIANFISVHNEINESPDELDF